MIVVLATTEDELSGARARLADLGMTGVEVMEPSDRRRLLVAPVEDESEGARVVAGLRAEGQLAVLRPAGGARLGAWTRHTRPVAIGDRLTRVFRLVGARPPRPVERGRT